MKWSKYQQAVFEDVANGDGHTVVNAVAGSGKTTTIVYAMRHVPPGKRTLFVAFNKGIAENLKRQAPKGVEVSTLHSYGLRTITRSLGRLTISKYRVDDFCRELMQRDVTAAFEAEQKSGALPKSAPAPTDREIDRETADLRHQLAKTVSLAKATLASEDDQIDEIIDSFGIDAGNTEEDRKRFISLVHELLFRCVQIDDGRIDFDDMIWLPLVRDLPQQQFDRVFVDETQDLNKAQIELTLRACRPGGRICAVGDPCQSIYAFRGADSSAVDNVVERLRAKVLPLSVCYRCAKSIVREAKKMVPHIEWAPDAAEGTVSEASESQMMRDVSPGDFILSRTNAPLISLCLALLVRGTPANIQGRDVGAALTAFVRKSNAKTVEELRDYVEDWRAQEIARLSRKKRDTQAVEDRADCILALSEGVPSVRDVIARIEELFADKDDANRVILSTTHKAKGMERQCVWVLSSTYRRRPGREEDNLYYVAVTRAQKVLFLVDPPETEEED